MKTALTVCIAVILAAAGCNGTDKVSEPLNGQKVQLEEGKELLTVDFKQGQSLRYKFVSNRDVTIDWDPTKKSSKEGKGSVNRIIESITMVIRYTPVKAEPYGPATIEATCESAVVKRSKQTPRKDAAESLAGKSFTFVAGPTGKIADNSGLDKLIKEVGKNAFRPGKTRTKEPDMIDDFTTSQCFLWDAVSSIEEPLKGVSVGQVWKSQLPIPTSMVLRKARNVTYTFEELRPGPKGRIAVISSSYSPAESGLSSWPTPYVGSFSLSGPLGFLRMFARGFNVRKLQGRGEELFNIDAGRIEQQNQQYELQLEATSLPLPGAKPLITMKQNLSMRLLKN